jgi:hypothetical protein
LTICAIIFRQGAAVDVVAEASLSTGTPVAIELGLGHGTGVGLTVAAGVAAVAGAAIAAALRLEKSATKSAIVNANAVYTRFLKLRKGAGRLQSTIASRSHSFWQKRSQQIPLYTM